MTPYYERDGIRLANMSNGLVYPHDSVCFFQSQHGHQAKVGYFRIDAMPYEAVLILLRGGTIEIIDATARDKLLTDAQKFGVPTWCLVFNRAIRQSAVVCAWETPEMRKVASSRHHKPLVQAIRRLRRIVGDAGPIKIGGQVRLTCHRSVGFDDKPQELARLAQEVLAL